MATFAKLFAVVAAFVATGCIALPPVRMDATPADLDRLAGKWRGEYTSPALGRSGTIEFELNADSKKASGVVLMMPQGSAHPYETHSTLQNTYDARNPMSSEPLTIFFVRAENGAVTGRLDRYWDPDRNCFAVTTFRGVVEGRTIFGTFRTTWDCGSGDATGEWKVTRKP